MYNRNIKLLQSLKKTLPVGILESKVLIHEFSFPLHLSNGEPFKVKIWTNEFGIYSATVNKYIKTKAIGDMIKGTKSNSIEKSLKKAFALINGYKKSKTRKYKFY